MIRSGRCTADVPDRSGARPDFKAQGRRESGAMPRPDRSRSPGREPIGPEEPPRLAQDRTVGVEPSGPPSRASGGIVIAHVRGRGRRSRRRDIGRVRDDQVEAAVRGPRPNPRRRRRRGRRHRCARHWPARSRAPERPVDADPDGRRKLVQQRHQETAGAGAEIEDAQRARPVRDQAKCGLDHGLGVRPRHQGLGGEREGEPPEFPLAEDARHRLARRAGAPRWPRALRPPRRSAVGPGASEQLGGGRCRGCHEQRRASSAGVRARPP